MRASLVGALLFWLLPLTASAQISADATGAAAGDETQPPQVSQGPMTVQRIHNGFLISPEVKATEFDKRAFPMVGGSAGFVAQETFFIGGGGYWMPTRRSDDRRLAYGGAIVKWFIVSSDRFGLTAGALLGGGEATIPETVTQIVYPPEPFPTGRNTPLPPPLPPRTITTTLGFRQDFVAAEPELNARVGLAKHVSLAFGAGYRFAGTDWRRTGIDRDASRRLSGATATFGVQIGG